jgi:hypothetical protein
MDLSEVQLQQIMKSHDGSPKSRFSMISLSSSIVSSVLSVGLRLTGEFTSLEEPTDDSDITADAVFSVDGSDLVKSEKRIVPREPTQNLRRPIVRSSPDPSL